MIAVLTPPKVYLRAEPCRYGCLKFLESTSFGKSWAAASWAASVGNFENKIPSRVRVHNFAAVPLMLIGFFFVPGPNFEYNCAASQYKFPT